MGPKANCERMAQIMFGAYNVPGDGANWDDIEKMRREAESFFGRGGVPMDCFFRD